MSQEVSLASLNGDRPDEDAEELLRRHSSFSLDGNPSDRSGGSELTFSSLSPSGSSPSAATSPASIVAFTGGAVSSPSPASSSSSSVSSSYIAPNPEFGSTRPSSDSFGMAGQPTIYTAPAPPTQAPKSWWWRAFTAMFEAFTGALALRVIFLVLLGVVVACLATIAGYVSIKSNSIRLSAEEKSATNAGSFVIWVAMTLALTTLSIFLASNHLSFFDDRTADGEGGTGVSSTTYERWSLSTRLCCQRRVSRRLVMVYDMFLNTCFGSEDELAGPGGNNGVADTRTGSNSIVGVAPSAANSAPISPMNDDDLEVARQPSSTNIVAEDLPTASASGSASSAVAVPAAGSSSSTIDWLSQQAEFDEAANARERANGHFSNSELEERQATRRQVRAWRAEWGRFQQRAVVGTGLPEVRAVLSGGDVRSTLSFRQVFMRLTALLSAMSAGLLVGGEGPFVLISASIAHLLSRVAPFRWFLQMNTQTRQQLLSTAAAVGIAGVFGSPFGGLLFSIEVTSTFYPMHSYSSSFLASFAAALTFVCLWNRVFDKPFLSSMLQTELDEALEARFYHLFYFALLGIICALLSLVFLHTQAALVRLQRRIRLLVLRHMRRVLAAKTSLAAAQAAEGAVPVSSPDDPVSVVDDEDDDDLHLTDEYSRPMGCCEPVLQRIARSSLGTAFMSNYTFPLLLVFLLAIFSFPNFIGDYLSKPSLVALGDLWSKTSLNHAAVSARHWFSGSGLYINLIVFIGFRFIFTAVSLAIPVPGGLLVPAMVVGAGVGRFVGELLGLGAVSYGAGVFAVVGAAGFCAALTQSLSLIIIVFEITGQVYFIAPLIVTVCTAVLLSSRLNPSIYEQMVAQQPHLAQAFLPQLPRWATRGKARDLMQTRIAALPERTSLSAINAMLLAYPNDLTFPVISSDRFLLGVVRRERLEAILRAEILRRHPDHDHRARRLRRLHHLMNGVHAGLTSMDQTSMSASVSSSKHSSAALDDEKQDAAVVASTASSAIVDEAQEMRLRTSAALSALTGRFDYVSAYGAELSQILVPLPFESVPVRLLPDTSLVHVHMLFISLQLQHAYVTEFGQLVGRVTRRSLCQTLSISQHTPSQRRVEQLVQQAQQQQDAAVARRATRTSRSRGTSLVGNNSQQPVKSASHSISLDAATSSSASSSAAVSHDAVQVAIVSSSSATASSAPAAKSPPGSAISSPRLPPPTSYQPPHLTASADATQDVDLL